MDDGSGDIARTPRNLYASALVLALAIIGGMVYVLVNGMRMSTVHDPLMHAALGIRHEATLAHLGFEEFVAGEPNASLRDAWDHLERAEALAQVMLQGGMGNEGYVTPLEDGKLRQEITGVLVQLRAFRNVANQRLARHETGVDGQLTHSFHAIYWMLTTRTDVVRASVQRTMEHEVAAFHHTQTVLIVICLILSGIVGTLFHRFSVGMARTVQALKERDEELSARTRELEHNNRELEQFAYVASHDLREPLRKIQAFGDRLVEKEAAHLSERGLDYVARMVAAAERMEALIEGLLLYSRCGTRTQPFAPVDLNRVAREVLSDLEARIHDTHAHVDVGPLPTIHADPMQMGQLFQNMISNALKFQEKGTAPRVKVRAVVHDDSLDLNFSDNGIGIPEEYTDRIFGVFQRLHGRDEYDGTGVGLSICKKAAERHGGNIEVISAPGRGTTFKVHLPVRPAVLEQAA
ncbi:MAG: hypothetical protein HZA24_11525 [Nitrospirae bacterium]|nr:hypothetical protein [Nitrospirota bacterium]